MVDTQLLDEAIRESGKSKSYLSDKCSMSVQTFRLKRLNISSFTTDEVEVLGFVLSIGVVIIDHSKVAVEGCRDAGHVAFVAKLLVFIDFFVVIPLGMYEVLLRFGKPGRRCDA